MSENINIEVLGNNNFDLIEFWQTEKTLLLKKSICIEIDFWGPKSHQWEKVDENSFKLNSSDNSIKSLKPEIYFFESENYCNNFNHRKSISLFWMNTLRSVYSIQDISPHLKEAIEELS